MTQLDSFHIIQEKNYMVCLTYIESNSMSDHTIEYMHVFEKVVQ